MSVTDHYDEVDIAEEERPDPLDEALTEFFSGVSPGMTVLIYRLEPSQYQGILETKTVTDASEPIDLNYLINTWGGHKLRLKFRRKDGTWAKHVDIDLYTYDPLVLGQPISRPRISPHLNIGSEDKIHVTPQTSQPQFQQPSAMDSIIPLMTALQTITTGQFEMLSKLLPQRQEVSQQPISQLGELMGLMMKMQSFASQSAPNAQVVDNGEDGQLLGLLGKAVEAFGATQKAETIPRLTGASHVQNIRPVPNPKPLTEQLSELSPDEILNTFQGVLASLPEDKQAVAMDTLLDALEKSDIISFEEDEEQDTSQDSQATNTGGTA